MKKSKMTRILLIFAFVFFIAISGMILKKQQDIEQLETKIGINNKAALVTISGIYEEMEQATRQESILSADTIEKIRFQVDTAINMVDVLKFPEKSSWDLKILLWHHLDFIGSHLADLSDVYKLSFENGLSPEVQMDLNVRIASGTHMMDQIDLLIPSKKHFSRSRAYYKEISSDLNALNQTLLRLLSGSYGYDFP